MTAIVEKMKSVTLGTPQVQTYDLGDFELQGGGVLPNAFIGSPSLYSVTVRWKHADVSPQLTKHSVTPICRQCYILHGIPELSKTTNGWLARTRL